MRQFVHTDLTASWPACLPVCSHYSLERQKLYPEFVCLLYIDQ